MNIIKFKNYDIINESVVSKILYHGSPKVFEKFKNTVTFFSESERFAINYAEDKSFDYALDDDPKLYKVKVNTDLFDINNKEDYDKIYDLLPDKVSYSNNNFGFESIVDKDTIMLNMTGFYINEPIDNISNKNIGDEFDERISMSQTERYKIIRKDDNYFYAYKVSYINNILNSILTRQKYDLNSESRKYYDYFIPLFDYVKEYIKKENPDKVNISNYDIIYTIMYNFLYDITNKKTNIKSLEEFDIIKNKCFQEALNEIIKDEIYIKKFNHKPIKTKLSDTWRYYENDTVYNAIVKLGYGGYVAKEKNVNTYAIFNPDTDVSILEYHFPIGIFKSWDDFKSYLQYDKYVADNLEQDYYKYWIWVDRDFIYNNYRNGLTKEENLNSLKNKLNDIKSEQNK